MACKPRHIKFFDVRIGQLFLWGSIDPLYRKIDEGHAVRVSSPGRYTGRVYVFAEKCNIESACTSDPVVRQKGYRTRMRQKHGGSAGR